MSASLCQAIPFNNMNAASSPTIPLHTDRIKLVGESERLLAAGERGRYTSAAKY